MPQLPSRQGGSLPLEIVRVESRDVVALGLHGRNASGKRAPKLRKALLGKFLIYQLQADALGDLDPELARRLQSYAARGARGGEEGPAKAATRAACETLTI